MRLYRGPLVIVVVLTVASCGRNTAETLETPFPGEVLSASSIHGRCSDEGCYVRYRVRITNPTGGAANVLTCTVEDGQGPQLDGLQLAVGQVSGVELLPRSTATADVAWYVPVSLDAIDHLIGVGLSCEAIDWHGDPPE
jgi:hypothetical protein